MEGAAAEVFDSVSVNNTDGDTFLIRNLKLGSFVPESGLEAI